MARATKAMLEDWLDRCVWVAPERCFGDACAGNSRVGAFGIALDVAHGETDELEEDCGLSRAQILAACWFIVDYRPRRWSRRWNRMARAWEPWVEEHWGALRSGEYYKVPFPPAVRV